ncbi:MAG: hypothetical protein FJZ57_05670 [Chlamydiae bacterium]|nr:hypothetical protein [Chlamydiota bacterium]
MSNSLNSLTSRFRLEVTDHIRIPYQAMSLCGLICSVKRVFERFRGWADPVVRDRSYVERDLFQREFSIIQVFKEFTYISSCALVLFQSVEISVNIPGLIFGSNILNIVSCSLELIGKIRGRLAIRSLMPEGLGVARVVLLKELKKSLDFKISVVALRVISASCQLIFSVTGLAPFGVIGCLCYLFSIVLQCQFSDLKKNNHIVFSRSPLIRDLVVG